VKLIKYYYEMHLKCQINLTKFDIKMTKSTYFERWM